MHGKWRLFRQEAGRVSGPPALVYILLFALCIAAGNWSAERYGAVMLWPANGVLVAALLQLHRRQAITVLASCFAINILGNFLRVEPPHLMVTNALLNLGEAMLAAVIARRFCGAALDLRRPVRLVRFVFLAAFPAVALSALIGVTVIMAPLSLFPVNFQTYFTVETLGMLIVTPTLILMARAHRFRDPDEAGLREKVLLTALLIAVTTAVFAQTAVPISFLVFVPLMLIALRLPPAWAALSVILVAIIAGAATLNGLGPITFTAIGYKAIPADVSATVLRALPVFPLYMSAMLALALPASIVLTERRRLEAKLKHRTALAMHARERAESAAEAKARFLSMMSHEMRTPLNGVAGFAELLARRPGMDAEALAQVEAIRRSSQRLGVLVDDILDFSHGEMEIAPEPFSPVGLARDVVEDFRAEAAAKGLDLTLALGFGPEARFYGDPRRLRQLLHHLVSNAVKFTPHGGVDVRVGAGEAGVVLEVADTGPGISPETFDILFQPFAQADGSISRAHEGAGLGLALCRRVAEAMGGEIRAANRPQGGAAFRVRLPMARLQSQAPEPEPPPEPAQADVEADIEAQVGAGAETRTRPPRVLVVDDHRMNREIAGVLLTAAGCETAVACGGAEAIEAVRTGRFDVVLMDVRMPGIDGIQAARSIRELPGPVCDIPIVAMTADAMPADVERCLEAGMDAHLAKPISQAGLLGVLSRVLDCAVGTTPADSRPAALEA